MQQSSALSYIAKYDSALLRGIDDPLTPRPWNLHAEISQHAGTSKILCYILQP